MISIIVPIYNVDNYLEECLKSVASQTYSNFEVIMVDDGSTDSSAEIAQKFVDSDERFKLIRQENKGQSAARNVGVKTAKGEFISFIDSDDIVREDMLEVLMKFLTDDIDIVECEYSHDSTLLKEEVGRDIDIIFQGRKIEALKALVLDHTLQHGPCAKLYRKELIEENLFPEGVKYEDLYFYLSLLNKAKHIVKINYRGYYYRPSVNSTMRSAFKKENLDIFKVCDLIEDEYKDDITSHPLLYRHLFACLVYHYMNYVEKNNPYKEKYEKYLDKYSKKALNTGVSLKVYKVFPKYFKQIMSLLEKMKR